MAISTKTKEYIALEYAKYFGRTATESIIDYYGLIGKTSKISKQIIKDANIEQYSVHGDNLEAEVHNEFQNLFSRKADNTELQKYVKVLQKGKDLPINSIVKKATKFDKDVYNNKQEIAKYVAKNGGGEFDLSKVTKTNQIDVGSLTSLADLQAKIDALPENSNVPSTFDGETYTLTTDVNTFKGTAKDDTFLATAKAHWSVADSIDGGKGIDRLKIIDAGAIAQADLEPTSATIKNVEILDLISGAGVTANTTSIDGITDLYTTSKGANSSTAAATTNINATATGAVAATAEVIAVKGGKDVTVVSKNNDVDKIDVGTISAAFVVSDAAAGKVSVTSTGAATGAPTLGDITVNGGTEITVNQNAGNAAGVGLDNTGGAITVNGNASTTTVTVNQSAINTGTATVVGYAAGAVTIFDRNATTAADTISTVTLKNYATGSSISSNALSTLNLESTGATSGTLGLNITTLDTTVLPTTLTVNSKGGSFGAVSGTMADKYTAVNINSSANTTIASAVFAANKTLTVDGAGVTTFNTFLTIGAGSNAALTSIVSKGAGLTIGTELDTDVAVTGGAGVENIKIGATTKTIDLGAGDDIATISTTAFAAGGSLNGGAGNDTLVVTVANSNIAGLPHIVGFETLRLDGVAVTGKHNAYTFKALEVGNITANTEFENVAAGVGLTVLAAPTGGTTVTLANATGTADVFNLTLSNATAATQAAGTVTIADVETINITTVDAGTAANTAATADSIVLVAADATSIVVSGNNGLTFTAAGSSFAKVTNFDASAVVGNDTAAIDTAANLAVTFVSANVTVGAAVSIKGGAGNDTLTGTAAANDTIIGGAGADTLVYTGRADTFTGGAGNDTFVINNEGTKALYLTITDLTKGDIINVTGMLTAAANGLVDGIVGAKTTLGAAATFDEYLNEAAKADGAATNAAVEWFQFEGNTYLVIDNAAANTFTEGTDAVIKITGLVDLTNATTTAATDIITIA